MTKIILQENTRARCEVRHGVGQVSRHMQCSVRGPCRGTHGLYRLTGEVPAPERGARRPHEDMGQLSLQVAGAEGLYGARGGEAGGTRGDGTGRRAGPRHTSGA